MDGIRKADAVDEQVTSRHILAAMAVAAARSNCTGLLLTLDRQMLIHLSKSILSDCL